MAVTDTGNSGRGAKRPSKLFSNMAGKIAAIPMIFTAVVVFIGCTLWTIYHSFTKSRLLPAPDKWVGLDNYERLWSENRWLVIRCDGSGVAMDIEPGVGFAKRDP